MEVKELMIDDLVLYNETPQRILEISCIDDEVYLETDELVHQSEIQPIPLTPEILEKNGFEKLNERRFLLEDLENNYWVKFYPKDTNYTCGAYDYININCGCITIREMPIEFVHQLQHALKLCGIEKEIIL